MGSPIKKPFNKDEVFAKIVRYYVDKKHYTLDQANNIAEKEVERQMRERGLIK